MGSNKSRRNFIKTVSGATAAVALGVQVPTITSAKAREDRFILDTSSTETDWKSQYEVVHDLSEIEIAIVRGPETELENEPSSRDVVYQLETPIGDANHEFDGDGKDHMQWDRESQRTDDIHVDEDTRGEGTRIGIIDSGVYDAHPDLNVDTESSVNLTEDKFDHNPVNSDHGTHVAGIAAAAFDTGDVVGMAPDAEIVAFRVGTFSGIAFGDVIAGVVESGERGCDSANLSLGAYPLPQSIDYRILEASMERAAEFAAQQGTVVVASAGNDAVNLDTDGGYISLPNDADGFMSISATGPIGFRWGDDDPIENPNVSRAKAMENLQAPPETPAVYTSYGADSVHLSAPGGNADTSSPYYAYDLVYNAGVDIVPLDEGGDPVSTDEDGNVQNPDTVADFAYQPIHTWKTGTSMAAPQVAGAVGLVRDRYGDATPEAVQYHLQTTSTDLPDVEYRGTNGGHLNAYEAVTTDMPFTEPITSLDESIAMPRDHDGDGLYEDVNGDGVVDEDDVHALYRIVTAPDVDLSPAQEAALDFADNGELSTYDISALLRQVRGY